MNNIVYNAKVLENDLRIMYNLRNNREVIKMFVYKLYTQDIKRKWV